MTCLRLALAAALLPALTACTAVVPLDLTRDLTLASPGGSFSAEQVVDLGAEPAVWSRRDGIDAISIDEITATVRSVGEGHRAAAVSLAVAFRPDGAPADGSRDLQAGTLAALPFVVGRSVALHGSAALDAFLLGALHGTGRFTVVVSGVLDGPANALVELHLAGSAAYVVIGK
jgi:hypothetical protein